MAIPRGRFYWDFQSGDENARRSRAKGYVKQWSGYIGEEGNNPQGEMWTYATSGVGKISLPPVVSTCGLIWFAITAIAQAGVTLGPKDTYIRYVKMGTEHILDYYREHQPVGWYYYWGGNFVWYYDSQGKRSMYYQSFGPNTYTVNRCAEGDSNKRGTLGILVTKGTHLSSGRASTLVLFPSSSTSNAWTEYTFWIWNPMINNWITGSMQGIKQTMTDSSHVLVTPIELNGYSFPEVFFADGASNSAFGNYCSPDQLREANYNIKYVKLNGQDFYVPISHTTKTIILIKHSPDQITIAH